MPKNNGSSVFIDIYGYEAKLRSANSEVLNGLADDFAFFRRPDAQTDRVIELIEDDPPYAEFPDVMATVYTPRNVSYRNGTHTLVDYSGRALGIHDRRTGSFKIYSRNCDLLYEAAYLFVLSQSGECLDSNHLHRVHALGVSIEGNAALVLLPMGGGKSTLGNELLRHPDVELLSDDSPLIDARGDIHAFPLRLGLLPGSEAGIPAEQLRRINRMEFGPKLLVSYSYFADRVRPKAKPCLLLVGRRSLSNTCEINPISKRAAMRAMLSNCVVGLGLFQGMEFVFQRSTAEVLAKAVTASARLRASWRLVQRSRNCEIVLGRDSVLNAETLVNALRER